MKSTNYKIEQSLAGRTDELNKTLDRMSGKAEELSRVVDGYSSSLEGSLTVAEQRARMIASEISKETEARSRSALEDLHRVKMEASRETDKALEELRREFTTVSQEVTQRLGSLTSQFSFATGAVREQAAAAARDLEQEQNRLKEQLDRLPRATEETATHMRRALNDQLRALDQLSSMANRTGLPDVTPPTQHQLPPPSAASQGDRGEPHQPAMQSQLSGRMGGPNQNASQAPNARGLSTLTSSLAREIADRNARSSTSAPSPHAQQTPVPSQQSARPQSTPQEAWSLGDLLARASETNEPEHRREMPSMQPPMPQGRQPSPPPTPAPYPPPMTSGGASGMPSGPPPASGASTNQPGLDINALSRALDPTTAASIWARFQSGQRGFMVRSIYAPESRNLFDGIARRYRADDNFKRLVDRFLNEYQNELSEADHRDQSGHASQQLIQSDTGRVYLVLAHASGRLI